MKIIKLTSGENALVDDQDYALISQWNWYENDQGYAYRKYYRNKIQKQIRMHRFLMDTPEGMDTDHINRNRLDNRRSNLRVVDRTQNNFNTGLYRNNSSGIKGVGWHKAANKWVARIQYNSKSIYLGCFESIELAHEARKEAERKYICV